MEPESGAASAISQAAQALVDQLDNNFREQVRRAIECELDHSATSLAFVDHYLSLAQGETREAIVTLLGGGAGAYFGEVIRQEIGGTWIGDGKDPRRLRLLLDPQFMHFSPVDLAIESIVAQQGGDEEQLAGLDTAFRLSTSAPDGLNDEARKDYVTDAKFVEERLAELPPLPVDQYYSLTGRFETLKLILEMLAIKHSSEGREPRSYVLADYVSELVEE